MRRTVVLLTVLVLAALATPAAAEVDVQQDITFNSVTEVEASNELTFSGSDAEQLRAFLDSDGDGNVSQQEADNFTESGSEPDVNWTLDGTSSDASFTDQSYENLVGPVAEDPPLVVSSSVEATFSDVEAGDEHTFVDNGIGEFCVDDGQGSTADTGQAKITIPSGYEVQETRPDDAEVSGSEVTATCEAIDGAMEITFAKGGVLGVPGFGAGLAVAVLVALAALRRRG